MTLGVVHDKPLEQFLEWKKPPDRKFSAVRVSGKYAAYYYLEVQGPRESTSVYFQMAEKDDDRFETEFYTDRNT